MLMRFLLFGMLLGPFGCVVEQQEVAIQNEDPYGIHTVKEVLLEKSQGILDGSTEKYTNRLGDKVSIALLKIFKEEELRDPRKIKQILPIIRMAFAGPQVISV